MTAPALVMVGMGSTDAQVAQVAHSLRQGLQRMRAGLSVHCAFLEHCSPTPAQVVGQLVKQGITEIAVISPAFSADCIETLEEIQGEIREAFIHAGGREFTYIPCLNAEPDHIDVLTALVAGVLFFALPALTQSSFANMGYWVDWANLLAVALGLGALVGVFCIPVAALLCPRCALKVR